MFRKFVASLTSAAFVAALTLVGYQSLKHITPQDLLPLPDLIASAHAACTVPYTFQDYTPGGPPQPILSGQINSNFSALAGCSLGFVQAPPQNLYVATTGNDAGQCTIGAPCLTLQRAVTVCYSKDMNSGYCIINVNPGTYSSPSAVLILGPLRGAGTGALVGRTGVLAGGAAGSVIFNGIGNPTITHTGNQCGTIYASSGASVILTGTLTLESNSSCAFGGEFVVQDPGTFGGITGGNVTFGPMVEAFGAHINLQQQGLLEVDAAGYSILAASAGQSAFNHAIVTTGGSLNYDGNTSIRCVANGGNAVNLGAAFYNEQIQAGVNVGAGTAFTNCGGITALQVSIAGNSTVQNFASGTNAIPGIGAGVQGGAQYLDASNHAIASAGIAGSSTFSDAAGTTAGPVMEGYGVGHTIATNSTGRLSITFNGQANNTLPDAGGTITLLYGTGTAPVHGAAVPGGSTICGATISIGNYSTATATPFVLPCYVKLTPGTSYWFDISLSSNSNTNTEQLTNVSSQAFELN